MHPLLVNISFLTWNLIIGDEAVTLKFLLDNGLILSKNDCPNCPNCGDSMRAVDDQAQKAKFKFVCKNKYRKSGKCNGTVSEL